MRFLRKIVQAMQLLSSPEIISTGLDLSDSGLEESILLLPIRIS